MRDTCYYDFNRNIYIYNICLAVFYLLFNFIFQGDSLYCQVVGHHVFPNDSLYDNDSVGNYPLMRTNPAMPLNNRWYLRYQHIYGPMLLYPLIGISYTFGRHFFCFSAHKFSGDFSSFLKKRYGPIDLQPLQTLEVFLFWMVRFYFILNECFVVAHVLVSYIYNNLQGKIVHLYLMVLLPCLFQGFW